MGGGGGEGGILPRWPPSPGLAVHVLFMASVCLPLLFFLFDIPEVINQLNSFFWVGYCYVHVLQVLLVGTLGLTCIINQILVFGEWI